MCKKIIAGVVVCAGAVIATALILKKLIDVSSTTLVDCCNCKKCHDCDLTLDECLENGEYEPIKKDKCPCSEDACCEDKPAEDDIDDKYAAAYFEDPMWQTIFLLRHDGFMSDEDLAESLGMSLSEFKNVVDVYDELITDDMYNDWRGFSLNEEEVDE